MIADPVAWCLQERDAKGADSNTKEGHLIPIAFKASHFTRGKDGSVAENSNGHAWIDDVNPSLQARTERPTANQFNGISQPNTQWKVRRLTPRECERLQGAPDDFTRVPIRHYDEAKITAQRPPDYWEKDPAGGWWLMLADGPRYRMLGNSMASNVMRYVGLGIKMVEEACV